MIEIAIKKNRKCLNLMSLTNAIEKNDLGLLKQLISEGADLNGLCSEGFWTPLGIAVNGNRLECLRVLLEANADVNKPDGSITPLHYATSDGYTECMKVATKRFPKWVLLFLPPPPSFTALDCTQSKRKCSKQRGIFPIAHGCMEGALGMWRGMFLFISHPRLPFLIVHHHEIDAHSCWCKYRRAQQGWLHSSCRGHPRRPPRLC